MLNLGVNIDHIATIRQARRGVRPDPIAFAEIAASAGAWGITAHLREDRRHICDSDIERLARKVQHLNMEMAVTDEMVRIACTHKPHSCCLVPEKREELTTEGGLNLVQNYDRVAAAVNQLQDAGIIVSLFIDPEPQQLDAAVQMHANYVELHTGAYANLTDLNLDESLDAPFVLTKEARTELDRLIGAAEYATRAGLKVNAGHGIDYRNIAGILEIPYLNELNIGYSIVARALQVGFKEAVQEMRKLMNNYPQARN